MRQHPLSRLSRSVLLASVVITLCSTTALCLDARPTAIGGAIDLSGWSFQKQGTVSLSGKWQFYWQRDAASPLPVSSRLVEVPGTWTAAKPPSTSTGSEGAGQGRIKDNGYGLYVLHLTGLTVGSELAIRLFGSEPMNLYVVPGSVKGATRSLQRPLLSFGVFGTSASTAIPETKFDWAPFRVESPTMTIMVELANYGVLKSGGLTYGATLGTKAQIQRESFMGVARAFLVIGVLLIMVVYHLSRFILRRTERASLFFALFCLDILLFNLLAESQVALHLFTPPTLAWFTALPRLYSFTYLQLPLFAEFIVAVFPKLFPRLLVRAYWPIAVICMIFAATNPFGAYTNPVAVAYDVIVALSGIYGLVGLFRAAFSGRREAIVPLVGIFIVVATSTSDYLVQLSVLPIPLLGQYGIILFIIAQALLLALTHNEAVKYIENVNLSLYRFVPKQFISHLGKSSIMDVRLGDAVSRHMTVMFSDIRSFTSMAEGMSPDESFRFLNSYLARVGPVIRGNHGYIDKYIGDGIMALFPEAPGDAFICGTTMLKSVQDYNADRVKSGYRPIQIGIGVHSGDLVLGTIGDDERIDGTVIADAVNISSRLEGLNKTYGSCFILTETILQALSTADKESCRWLGLATMKGRRQPVSIYEALVEAATEGFLEKVKTKLQFEKAVGEFAAGRLWDARNLFQELAKSSPADGAADYYANRCEELITLQRGG